MAPSRHPGGPGGTQEARGVLEGKCVKTCVFYCRKWRDRPFRVDGSAPTLTKYRACAQKLSATQAAGIRVPSPDLKVDRENHYS